MMLTYHYRNAVTQLADEQTNGKWNRRISDGFSPCYQKFLLEACEHMYFPSLEDFAMFLTSKCLQS